MSNDRRVWNMRDMIGRGRARRAKVTEWWVFVAHLGMVFSATVGSLVLFSSGHWGWGIGCAAMWVVMFAITAMDNVRIPWVDRMVLRVLVFVDTLRSVGDSEESKSDEPRGEVDV